MPLGWREQYDRMKRAIERAKSSSITQQTVDDYYTFFVWTFHLKDWLKSDAAVAHTVSTDAERLVNSSKVLRLCADLANGVKHLRLNTSRIDTDVRLEHVAEFTSTEADTLETTDAIIVVSDRHQILWDVREVADACMEQWECFLRERGLL